MGCCKMHLPDCGSDARKKDMKSCCKKEGLNLGCGNKPIKGYINLDRIKFKGVDVVHDLNSFPYPFRDNQIQEVRMEHVLEHLDNPIRVLEEIYRICKNDAETEIIVPHFASGSAYIDPTHKHYISWGWFRFFDKSNKKTVDYNFKCDYRMLSKEITFPAWLCWFKWFANKFPGFYDTNLCFIFRPKFLMIKIKAVKKPKESK